MPVILTRILSIGLVLCIALGRIEIVILERFG
jgi:hypothetical protein